MSNQPAPVRYDLAVIALVAAATHGLLLLMDGAYFDGHLLYSHLTTKNWPVLHQWFDQAGLMFFERFYRAVGTLPDIVFGYRLLAFLSITLTSVLWYLVCYQSRMLSRGESLCIALIQLTFPAFRTIFSLIVLPYLVCYLLFVLGVYLALRNHDQPGRRGVVPRLASLLLLFLSFSTNSLLVFYLGFIVFMVFFVRATRGVSLFAAAKSYLFRHVDFLALPFVYWLSKELFTPRHGLYEHYNRIGMPLKEFLIQLAQFTANSVLFQLNDALLHLLAFPALGLVVVAAVMLVYTRIEPLAPVSFESRTPAGAIMAAGSALAILAMVPYVLVGKFASVVGWNTRFSLLVSIGVGVLIVGAFKALSTRPGRQLSRTGVAVMSSLIAAFSIAMVDSYASWQQRWIKDCSVEIHLKGMPPCPASTYWIEDRFPLPEEVSRQPYWDYDWATIFKDAWGGETRAGIYPGTDLAAYALTRGDEYRAGWGRIGNLSEYDPAGPQARLTIRPGPSANGIRMIFWYWWYRYANPAKFEAYARSVTEVSLELLTPTPAAAVDESP